MNVFKDEGHLFRLAAVFIVGLLIFLVIRGFLVPKSFGQFGHYRADSVTEIAARPIKFAGHESCEGCHADVVEKKNGKHAGVNCEACHGPQAQHADDPTAVNPTSSTQRCYAPVVMRQTRRSRGIFRSSIRRNTLLVCLAIRATSLTVR
jgi:hypothetical protein